MANDRDREERQQLERDESGLPRRCGLDPHFPKQLLMHPAGLAKQDTGEDGPTEASWQTRACRQR